jgi:tetratricopeptide (TPR) repeat protein
LRHANALGQATAAAVAEYDAAIALDREFGFAYGLKTEGLAYLNRLDDALQCARDCLEAVPTSAQCVRARSEIEEELGRCAAMEADARRESASDPTDYFALGAAANAVYGAGATLDAAAELLARAREKMPTGRAARSQLEDRYALAVLSGDFTAAELAMRDEERLVTADPTRVAHGQPARRLVRLFAEEGDDARAAAVADEYLRRAPGWDADPHDEDFAMARDPTPVMLAALRRAGRLSPASFAERRETWLAGWTPKPAFARHLWAHAWATPAESPDDAAAAIAALATVGDPPRYAPLTLLAADIGRTYLLAGRTDDETIAWLRQGATACRALDFPIEHVRARLWLGRALEQRGDVEGACGAYASVLGVFGSARPRSVTADEARTRTRALGCKAPRQ